MRSIRLKHRIALGFVVLQLLLAGLGATSVVFLDRAAKETAELHAHAYAASLALGEVRNRTLEIKSILSHHIAFPDSPLQTDWVGEIRRHQTIIGQNLAVAAGAFQFPATTQSALETAWTPLDQFIDSMVADLKAGHVDVGHQRFHHAGQQVFNRLLDSVADAMIGANAYASERVGQSEILRQELRGTVLSLVAAALVLGALLSTALTLAITRPLARLRAAMVNVNEGDPEQIVPDTERGDELGDIARALEQLKQDAWEKRRTQVQFATIFDASPDIVTISERDTGRFLNVNHAFETHLGYRRDEVLGKVSLEMGIWATPAHRAALVQALIREGRLSNFRSQARRRNGEVFDALVSVEQFRLDDKPCMIFVARDITPLIRQEELLRRSLAELETSNRELERFAHVAAHDLQEPCRTICSFAQLLERADGAKLSAEGREYLAFLSNGAIRMRQQIQGLLDYSRVDISPAPFVPVDLEQVADWVIQERHLSISEHRATIHRTPLPTVSGDPVQLRQLMGNLIGNALKFQPPGQNAELWIGAEPAAGQWRFTVADNGIGIDANFKDEVFGLFRRLHGPAQYPGSGLGLTIAKRIVERHGGKIWIEPRPGQGTAIHFTLPALEQEQIQNPTALAL